MAARQKNSKIKEFRQTIIMAISAAFGLVIALAWNDAIKAIVNELLVKLGVTGTGYAYQIIAAVIVTIIALIGIWMLARWKE